MTLTDTVVHMQDKEIERLRAELVTAKEKLAEEKEAQERFAIRIIGQEAYDNSPCQAHPLELVEARLAEAEAAIRESRATMGQFTGLSFQTEQDRDRFLHAWLAVDNYHYKHLRATDSAPAVLTTCPSCGDQLLDPIRDKCRVQPSMKRNDCMARAASSAPDLCEDEGCPQHGMPHVCITRVTDSVSVDYKEEELERMLRQEAKAHIAASAEAAAWTEPRTNFDGLASLEVEAALRRDDKRQFAEAIAAIIATEDADTPMKQLAALDLRRAVLAKHAVLAKAVSATMPKEEPCRGQ